LVEMPAEERKTFKEERVGGGWGMGEGGRWVMGGDREEGEEGEEGE